MKICTRCLKSQPLDNFFNDKHKKGDGKYPICKECKTSSTYKWRSENREHYNQKAREWGKKNPEKRYKHEIKRLYGCTSEKYDSLLSEQNNKCWICEKQHNPNAQKGRLYLDHCHDTGKIRGLLCGGCNLLLGYACDKPELLTRAIAYLAKDKS